MAGSFTVTTTGFPAPSLTEVGALPSGVTFDTATGSLSGTPAAGTGGTYTLTFNASKDVGSSASQSFTLTVNQAPAITNSASATFTVGTAGSFTVTPTGFPAPTLSETGTLPGGLTFNASTGTLSGTPAPGTGGTYPITFAASNGVGTDAAQSFTLTVDQAPTITSTASTTFTVSTVSSFSVSAKGFPKPSLSETGTLPSGVTFNASTGILSGTPATGAGGTYALTFAASNSVGTNATQSFVLTVDQAPAITSAASAVFTVGAAGSFVVAASGFPVPTFSETGALPAGVSLSSSGLVSGTATVTGTFPITVTASNGISPAATQSFTLTIGQPAAITSANKTTFTVGMAGSFSVMTTGYPAPALSESGTLPSGVTLNASTGALGGTPATGTAGSYSVILTASNGVGTDASQTFTLAVNNPVPSVTSLTPASTTAGSSGQTLTINGTNFVPSSTVTYNGATHTATFISSNQLAIALGVSDIASGGAYPVMVTNPSPGGGASNSVNFAVKQAPAITSAASTAFVVGTAGSFTLTSTGFPAPTLSETGILPGGVTFNAATGALSGTPTASTGGNYPVTFTASNGVGTNATQSFTLTVNQAPAITSATSTTFTKGATGSFTVTATGFPSPTIAETGALPTGVTLSPSGALTGTPAAGTGGTYGFSITASNGIGSNAMQNFTLTVDEAPAITSPAGTTFTVGTGGSFTVTATGFPVPTLSESGPLPTGVTFNTTTGALSGTPAAGTGGTYALTFTASNGVGSNSAQSFTLTVDEAPTITSIASTTFTVGTAGSFNIAVTGFPAPTLSESGALPAGVTFNSATGVLGGTPAASTGGTYPITFTASNGIGSNATQSFSLTVDQPPTITSAGSTTFTVGTAGSFTVTATGFPAPTLSESGALPTGVTLSASGSLSGTPTTSGTFPITITASNGVGTNATQSFTLTVDQAPAITSTASATFTVGTAGSFTVTASGFPAPTLSETGTLPSGVTFNAATGVLGGTPAATTGGTYPISFTATNVTGSNATQSFVLTVDQAPAITSAANTTFTVGTAGSFTVSATGFPAPSFSETGTLPGGISLSTSTGILGGTPATSAGGTYSFTITASNGVGTNATQSFTLTVNNPAPSLASVSPTQVSSGSSGTTLVASGSAFVPLSVIQVNGTAISTTFVSTTQLTGVVPTTDLVNAGLLAITVMSPTPGGGTSGSQNLQVLATVSVSPTTAAPLTGGSSTQFSATVSGTTSQTVTWSLVWNGTNVGTGNSTVGTISSTGLYTSPAYVPYPASVTVQATSSFDNTGYGTSAVTVTSPVEDWPKYHHDLSNTGQTSETAVNSMTAPHLMLKWSFSTPGGKISASPAVATINVGGTPTLMVFVGSWNGTFYGLDATTGTEIWSFQIDTPANSGECATIPIDCTRIASSPAVANGDVYFGAGNGYVYCLDAATGTLVWKYQLGDPTLGAEIWTSPAVYTASVGGTSTSVVAFALSSHDDAPCVPGQVELFNALAGTELNTFNVLQGCTGGGCVGGGVWASPAVDTSVTPPVVYIGTGNPGNSCSPASTGTPTTAYTDSIVALNGATFSLLNDYQAYTSDPNDAYDFGSSPVLHTTSQCTASGNGSWVTEANKGGTLFTIARNSLGLILAPTSTEMATNLNPLLSGGSVGAVVATPALASPNSSSSDCNNLYQPVQDGYLFNLQQAGDGTGSMSAITTSPWPVPVNISGGCSTLGNCPLFSAPASAADILAFGGGDGNFYVYTTSGAKAYSFGTLGLVASGPAISHGRIYFGSYGPVDITTGLRDGVLYCLSVDGQ